MNPPSQQPQEPVWSWKRWLVILAVGTFLHALIVFWLNEKSPPIGVLSAEDPFMKVVVDEPSLNGIARNVLISDPTLFALPSRNGFSSQAWLALRQDTPPSFTWSEAPRWLPLDTNELGIAVLNQLKTNTPAGYAGFNLLNQRAGSPDIVLLKETPTTQTVATIEGALTNRTLLAAARLANPSLAEIPPDTILHLTVNAQGWVESSIVLDHSGITNLDQQAITWSKSTRFSPLNDPQSTTSGKVIIHWFPVALNFTNGTLLDFE